MQDKEDQPSKRTKISGKETPTTFVTWNVNGLTSRCGKDCLEVKKMMEETEYPDVVCLQEVRLKASPQSRAIPLQSELKGSVQQTLQSVFRDYTKVYWSLADKRYSGTLTLLHKRLDFHGETAFTPDSAISMLAKRFGVTREITGIPPPRKSSKGNSNKKQQPSVASFFKAAPKKEAAQDAKIHHEEGRFQCFCFPTMDLVQTYVPNNGLKHESIKRRRDWDADMLAFFQHRKQLLEHVGQEDRPILWCGDMNCALTHLDGSHWKSTESGEIEEFWTDETKSLTSTTKKDEGRHIDDMGIPSFTPNERLRMRNIIATAGLSDVWRERFPHGDSRKPCKNEWGAPNYSWRGHIGTSSNFQSKYEGKGQRLDYFLLTSSLMSSVTRCDILGYETQRLGFCGSDHCPLILHINGGNEKERSQPE